MSFEWTVVDGAIVLDGGVKLPEGARVRVRQTSDVFPDEPAVVDMSPRDLAPEEPASSARADGPG